MARSLHHLNIMAQNLEKHIEAGMEVEPAPPELGNLVQGLDFNGVVAWAKDQNIPAFDGFDGMLGSTPITIDGKKATVGWVGSNQERPGHHTPAITVDNPGGEIIVVTEGSIAIMDPDRNKYQVTASDGAESPGFLKLKSGQEFVITDHRGKPKSWYVCFYPEAQT